MTREDSDQQTLKWWQVAFIMTVITQLAGSVWIVSALNSRVENHDAYIIENKASSRDVETRIRYLENQVIIIQSDINELKRRVNANGR